MRFNTQNTCFILQFMVQLVYIRKFSGDYMKKIKELLVKHKEIILYILFGGMTTLINIVVYSLCYYALHTGNSAANIISWVLSVLFAYVTNKVWVFESKSINPKVLAGEVLSFFGCRLATGALDFVIMYIAVDILLLPAIVFKVLSNVIVIVLNYIASKLLIFNKRKDGK